MAGAKKGCPEERVPPILVVGASGFIGSRLLESFRREGLPVLATSSRKERPPGIGFLDLESPDLSGLDLKGRGIRQALLLGAVTSIDRCRREPERTRRINVEGTLRLAERLASEGVKPVFFSSDYVFDGAAGGYDESSPVAPGTEYGRQKAEVERRLGDSAGERRLVVRLSKVFGLEKGDRTLLDEMAELLASERPVRAAYDQVFSPVFVGDVIEGVRILLRGDICGIVHLCGPETVSRYDLARRLAARMGAPAERIERLRLDEIVGPGRPVDTSMKVSHLFGEKGLSFTPLEGCVARVSGNWTA